MPEQAESYRFNPFDVTKVWPHGDFPVMKIGRMVLNRNPSNYFAEVEQAAFSPANFVPGIAASPDKMLQGRLFAYNDAHRYRLGANYHLLPVNAPKGVKADNYQRDGAMRSMRTEAADPTITPTRWGAQRRSRMRLSRRSRSPAKLPASATCIPTTTMSRQGTCTERRCLQRIGSTWSAT